MTTRLSIPYPAGVDPADVPLDMQQLANALDAANVYQQGTLASRPAFGLQGRFYFATDQGVSGLLYWDTGSAWKTLTVEDAAAAIPSLRSLGSSPTQAAAGDDSRFNRVACRVTATANVAIAGLLTIDGVTLVDGDRVLLVAQSTGAQNGPWVAHSGAWTRPDDAASGSTTELTTGTGYYVSEGTYKARTFWRCSTTGTITIDTTSTAWMNLGWLPRVTAIPSSPVDGMEIYYADATMLSNLNGWHLKYVSAAAGLNKWFFVGGSSLGSKVNTEEGTAAVPYVNLATVGPDVVIPLTGIYDIRFGCGAICGDDEDAQAGVGIGNFVAPFTSCFEASSKSGLDGGVESHTLNGEAYSVAMTAGDTIRMRYGTVGGANVDFRRRWLSITPRAVQ